jgi:L-2-hydroxyglutarate oxidase LhgO
MKGDIVVIGAGVIGLAVARALALSGHEVMVLEAHPGIGMETSSRNSEVIHAGLYYPPGSLKSTSCIQGKQQLYAYCERKGVPYRRIGKLIVATTPDQVGELERIHANAVDCGVDDLAWLSARQRAAKEPAVRAEATLWSPSTGIIDSHALMLALQADLEAGGGTVACHTRVLSGERTADGVELLIDAQDQWRLQARWVVNAAGLRAANLASRIRGIRPETIPRIHLVRGHYFTYAGRSLCHHLVYPLPGDGGLGIHATLDLAGQLRFGPDSEPVEHIDYVFDERRHARFADSIRSWLPGLDPERLRPGYTGIRPRLASPGEGFRDFEISMPETHGITGLVNLYGIESPGLTACLALADTVAASILSAG